MTSRRRKPAADRPSARYRSARAVAAELGQDLEFLALKGRMGEPLTAAERDRLEAARSAGPKPAGGAP